MYNGNKLFIEIEIWPGTTVSDAAEELISQIGKLKTTNIDGAMFIFNEILIKRSKEDIGPFLDIMVANIINEYDKKVTARARRRNDQTIR